MSYLRPHLKKDKNFCLVFFFISNIMLCYYVLYINILLISHLVGVVNNLYDKVTVNQFVCISKDP